MAVSQAGGSTYIMIRLVPPANAPVWLPEYTRSIERNLREASASPFVSRSITASGTASTDDYLILVNANAGAVTVTLPAAASSVGAYLVVKKTDASANTVTVDANASETIDGATTRVLTGQYDAVTIVCDGAAWWIV